MRRSFGILVVTIVGVAVGCTFPPPPGATVLAIAYTNVDGVNGFDESRGDVLIAKLVDTNGDGAASAGDTVITNQYPTSTDPVPPFGSFRITTHEVTEIAVDVDELLASTTFPTTGHEWGESASFGERYGECGPGSVGQADTGFIDEFRSGAAGGTDFIAVDPMSPSRPEDSISGPPELRRPRRRRLRRGGSLHRRALNAAPGQSRPGSAAPQADLPTPSTAITRVEATGTRSGQYVRLDIEVTNWQAYHETLFVSGRQYSACGEAGNKFRTWVDILDGSDGRFLFRYCAIGSPHALPKLFLFVSDGEQANLTAAAQYWDIPVREVQKAGVMAIRYIHCVAGTTVSRTLRRRPSMDGPVSHYSDWTADDRHALEWVSDYHDLTDPPYFTQPGAEFARAAGVAVLGRQPVLTNERPR